VCLVDVAAARESNASVTLRSAHTQRRLRAEQTGVDALARRARQWKSSSSRRGLQVRLHATLLFALSVVDVAPAVCDSRSSGSFVSPGHVEIHWDTFASQFLLVPIAYSALDVMAGSAP
jgi:hypothetical protein